MSDEIKPELTPLNPPERERIYHFAGGETIILKNVTHLLVRPSGNHRLQTADNRKWIIPPTYLAISIDVDEFCR